LPQRSDEAGQLVLLLLVKLSIHRVRSVSTFADHVDDRVKAHHRRRESQSWLRIRGAASVMSMTALHLRYRAVAQRTENIRTARTLLFVQTFALMPTLPGTRSRPVPLVLQVRSDPGLIEPRPIGAFRGVKWVGRMGGTFQNVSGRTLFFRNLDPAQQRGAVTEREPPMASCKPLLRPL